ncbi:hypothetical protein KSF73_05490 [Burkholderiaceae bacterium DAT-1]|nr:hypothetical protein [Burkholderiaceae bacterium DAT-1]
MKHAFDFLLGTWIIENQRLRTRLQGCTEWETFTAHQCNRPLPGGIGNYDDFIAESWRPGFVGMSLRIFDPRVECWSIYWLDNVSGGLDTSGVLLPPVVGRFEQGVGTFECDDTLDRRPIRVRYSWLDTDSPTPRWEQAMSDDGGKSWETNWIMIMRRADA